MIPNILGESARKIDKKKHYTISFKVANVESISSGPMPKMDSSLTICTASSDKEYDQFIKGKLKRPHEDIYNK